MNERDIFEAAIEIIDPEQCRVFLDAACGGDPALRGRIDALIRSHRAAGDFLNQVPAWDSPTIDDAAGQPEKVGSLVGPYKLLQLIGEGGMGLVFMAEQSRPLRRRVALKIIKPGMDTRQVIARFEAERQALAIMDHPNIAKVLDAGATAGGRPFFVMELVNGIPITQYADLQQLDSRQRLELFVPICEAVQHAHQKGIIHRDLKPTNVLIALYDGRPVPKIIDFGIAKAVDQRLTEHTLFTALGQVVGTLEYMSPEQATRNQLDIDTRSDIYSLGVLLYELLTGETPLDKRRLKSAAWDEILRIIREEEPPRPSAKLSSSDRLAAIAASRRTEPAKLSALLRGELDWILAKSLEKDRTRRYESASQFGADVRRYLTGEAVAAGPPSSVYRLRKSVRRHWRALGVVGLVASSLLIGFLSTLWQARRALDSESKAHNSLTAEREARMNEDAARQNALASEQSARTAQRVAERRLSQVYTERGLERVDTAPHTGLPWLIAALKTDAADPQAHLTQRLRLQLLLHDLPGLAGYWPGATQARFSSNESTLAVVVAREVWLVDTTTRNVHKLVHAENVEGIAISPADDCIATVAGGRTTPPVGRVWQVSTGQSLSPTINLSDNDYPLNAIPTLRFSPDGKRLVAVTTGMTNRWHTKMVVQVFATDTWQQLGKTFAHHSNLDFPNGYHSLSPDCLTVLVPRGAVADDPRVPWNSDDFPQETERVQQYNLLTGASLHPPLDVKLNFYTNVQYNTDGTLIATSDNGLVNLWNAHDGASVRQFQLSLDNQSAQVWFHPDGTSLLSIEKHKASWYDISTGTLKREWFHQNKFSVDPSGKFVAYRNTNEVDYLCDLAEDEQSPMWRLPEFRRVRFAANGARFVLEPPPSWPAAVSESRPERIYRSSDAQPVSPPWRFEGELSASGRYYLCQQAEGVWLWDLDQARRAPQTFPLDRDVAVLDAAITADGQKLVVVNNDGRVTGWDTHSDKPLFEPFRIDRPQPDDPVSRWTSIKINADATLMAAQGVVRASRPDNQHHEQDVVQVWRLHQGKSLAVELLPVALEDSYISEFCFQNNSTHLLITELVQRDRRSSASFKSDTMRVDFIDLASMVRSKTLELPAATRLLELSPDESQALVLFDRQLFDPNPSTTNPSTTGPYCQLVSLASGQPVSPRIAPMQGNAANARLTIDGQRLILGDSEVWDLASGQRLNPSSATQRTVDQIIPGEDGQSFLAISNFEKSYGNFASELRWLSFDGRALAPPMLNQHTSLGPCTLVPNKHLLAIAGTKLRLWDTISGLPLSGAIELYPVHPSSRARASRLLRATGNGNRLFVQTEHDLFLVDLQMIVESTPSDEVLEAWSQVLTAQRIDTAGGVTQLNGRELNAAWQSIAAPPAAQHRSVADPAH